MAANAIRAASQNDAALVEHWDFDLGGPLFDGKPVCCIDAGDIPTIMHDNAGNRARIETKTREILASPAVPILLGGDVSRFHSLHCKLCGSRARLDPADRRPTE